MRPEAPSLERGGAERRAQQLPMRTPLAALLAAALVAGLYGACAAAAQAPEADPPHVVRGRQTEAKQRAFADRLDRLHGTLADVLRTDAPGLLKALDPPSPKVSGYQILPRIVPDGRSRPPTPAVATFSWRWSDTLIDREMTALDRIDADLTDAARPGRGRRLAALTKVVESYRKVLENRKRIDAGVEHNRLWQARIFRDRPLFDRLDARLEAARAALSSSSGPGRAAAPVLGFDLAAFVEISQPAAHRWVVAVPLVTDIADTAFLERFRAAVETHWRVRAGAGDYRVALRLTRIPPSALYCGDRNAGGPAAEVSSACTPPENGAPIDPARHVARFPKGAAVLTTGAAAMQTVGDALVLGPHDVSPRTLAHEFGHLLGLPDAYYRGYRYLGADGFQVREFVADMGDIMASPGYGAVQARHFQGLLIARDVATHMTAGLDALYTRGDAADAVTRFRAVLARHPGHYGATLQLAKALDRAGRPGEALVLWERLIGMAEGAGDAATLRTVRARLSAADSMP